MKEGASGAAVGRDELEHEKGHRVICHGSCRWYLTWMMVVREGRKRLGRHHNTAQTRPFLSGVSQDWWHVHIFFTLKQTAIVKRILLSSSSMLLSLPVIGCYSIVMYRGRQSITRVFRIESSTDSTCRSCSTFVDGSCRGLEGRKGPGRHRNTAQYGIRVDQDCLACRSSVAVDLLVQRSSIEVPRSGRHRPLPAITLAS